MNTSLEVKAGMYLERLAYEDDKKVDKLTYAKYYAESDTSGDFIVNYKAGFVSFAPVFNYENIERLIKKLES